MVTLTVNGRQIKAPRGSTILEACRLNGIEIPTLCYDPDLRLAGSCRMCLVEAKGRPLFLASCVAPAEDGMVIETESQDIVEARRVVLELLAARHEFNCQTCEKNGDCKFQDYCYQYGVKETRFTDGGRYVYPINDPNPFIERDYNNVLCALVVCVPVKRSPWPEPSMSKTAATMPRLPQPSTGTWQIRPVYSAVSASWSARWGL